MSHLVRWVRSLGGCDDACQLRTLRSPRGETTVQHRTGDSPEWGEADRLTLMDGAEDAVASVTAWAGTLHRSEP